MRLLVCVSLLSIGATAARAQFPEEHLPEYVRIVHEGGERVDWSLDGSTIAFVTKEGGSLREKNIETGEIRKLSAHYDLGEHSRYYRVMYMADGNLLATGGPERYDAYMQVLVPGSEREPYQLRVKVIEGPAVSRLTLPVRIAYCPEGQDKIRVATLRYDENGTPFLENDRLVIDGHDLPDDGVNYIGMVEPQNWRPPDEKELIFSRYAEMGGFSAETWGWHSETGELINYSRMPDHYAEPEGIFPDGDHTLIESDRDDGRGVEHLDLYRLKLDGSGEALRLTNFADVGAWKANNGVISPDGRYMAFQESQGGFGQGWGRIYLLDLEAAGIAQP
ncbi:MAG: hypothetical protein R3178_06880 [Rhodothermales bacterium]|nr:hypothetical protein [Rhodothermales bacterium]